MNALFQVFPLLLYLDPGSGSLFIQMLIAAILGVGIFVRTQWARIKKWFGKNAASDEDEDEDEEEND